MRTVPRLISAAAPIAMDVLPFSLATCHQPNVTGRPRNRSRAARLLGISRATLYRRLEAFEIR